MAKRIVWMVVSCLMVLSLVIASCGPKEEVVKEEPVKEEPVKEEPVKEEPVQKEEVGVPKEEVPWWEEVHGKPKYGGTLTYRLGSDLGHVDSYYMAGAHPFLGKERLFQYNYAQPTQEGMQKYRAMPYLSTPYSSGVTALPVLAESWEQTDPVTYVIHIKKGVHYWNKPPVNGREFTAYDVEYTWHRLMGLGKYGFTKPSPFALVAAMRPVIAIDAIDKYTVVWKYEAAGFANPDLIMQGVVPGCYVAPKEAVDLWGDKYNDWKYVVATGSVMISDYVTGSCVTNVRNPDYHGYDERYPENRLPYYDIVKQVIIPDASTALSGLRTGKIDYITGLDWEQAESLKKTTPQLMYDTILDSGSGINLRVNKEPFTDLRVRKAMQMAMDLKTLAKTYYGGYVDGTPMGFLGPYATNNVAPYEEWSQELKDDFAYNPEGAKKLLAEAGYPQGFKCTIAAGGSAPSDLLLVVKAWLLDIGIDMTVQMFEGAAYTAWTRAEKDQMNWGRSTGANWNWETVYTRMQYPNDMNLTSNNDAVFNALYDKALLADTLEERNKFSKELYLYDLKAHWGIYLQPAVRFMFWWPWFQGYDGENPHAGYMTIFMNHWWIDEDLKKAMGY